MVGAAHDQVFHIRLPTVTPRLEVVDLGEIGRLVAARPGAAWVFCSGHDALFVIGHARRAVEVDRPFFGVHERDVAGFSIARKADVVEYAPQIFGAGNGGAIGQVELDIVAVAVADANEFV